VYRLWYSELRLVGSYQCLQIAYCHHLQGKNKPTILYPQDGLRRCATNWKEAGSIPDGVSGIFY